MSIIFEKMASKKQQTPLVIIEKAIDASCEFFVSNEIPLDSQ